jgi:hypothetical protein
MGCKGSQEATRPLLQRGLTRQSASIGSRVRLRTKALMDRKEYFTGVIGLKREKWREGSENSRDIRAIM